MKNWFQNLDSREQSLVAAGAIFSLLALIYLLLWRPLNAATADLQKNVEQQTELHDDLVRLQGRISAPGSAAQSSAKGQSLVVLVSQTVDQFKLDAALKSSQPAGANVIRVQFEEAAFDTMVTWLGELNTKHGLSIQNASFSKTAVTGRVDSNLTLERHQ